MSAPAPAVGPEKVRRGYLSTEEREALAALLEAIGGVMSAGAQLPDRVRTTYAAACRVLHREAP